jgi:hypothetical protein
MDANAALRKDVKERDGDELRDDAVRYHLPCLLEEIVSHQPSSAGPQGVRGYTPWLCTGSPCTTYTLERVPVRRQNRTRAHHLL